MNIPRPQLTAFSRAVGIVIAISALLACDPAMRIRQSYSGADRSTVGIEVKEAHPFVGEKNYAPIISVTNPYDAPISIEHVELRINGRTYSGRRMRTQDWPINIAAKSTEQVDALFDLGDTVRHVLYGTSGELRLYVRVNGREIVASATVMGQNLR